MANQFTHEEEVMFDKMVEGFDDMLIIAKGATNFQPEDGETMEHLGDRIWIPSPMISASYDGFDQTANFGDMAELAVPISIGYHKSANGKVTAKDLRSTRTLTNYAKAAKQKLSSDINHAIFTRAAMEGSVFIKRTTAPTGYDDVSLADAAFTEVGVGQADRMMFMAPRVANAVAGDLAKRSTFNGAVQSAYERANIGIDIAGFDVYKNDQSVRLAAATGGAILVNGANQYYVPKAQSTATTGEISNVDNRYSDLVVDGGTYANIKAGDAFTLPGVNSVHMITKQDTGQLQTFRVISKPAANTIRIAPAIISAGGGTKPEIEYQNVTAAPADNAALTWLNTTAAELNPFFKRESLLLIPGSYSVDSSAGWNVMSATTDLGVALTYVRQGEINDLSMKFRWDVDFGTALTAPQLAGNMAFGQA